MSVIFLISEMPSKCLFLIPVKVTWFLLVLIFSTTIPYFAPNFQVLPFCKNCFQIIGSFHLFLIVIVHPINVASCICAKTWTLDCLEISLIRLISKPPFFSFLNNASENGQNRDQFSAKVWQTWPLVKVSMQSLFPNETSSAWPYQLHSYPHFDLLSSDK